jgi:L-ectoine synthase
MIVKSLTDVVGTPQEIHAENWTSRRLLLRNAGMGFSMHDTLIHAGTSTEMHYQNHLEAVYCVRGKGSIRLVDTGETFEISDGTIYALNGHERHVLTAETELRMVCVFTPALVGDETHDSNGVYPLVETANR